MIQKRFAAVSIGLLLLLLSSTPASPAVSAPGPAPAPAARIRIVLVGDSTVTDDYGWGSGFKRFVGPGAECINAAASGRSSKSYIDEGRWRQALELAGDYYLIQFGHNDQPGKGPARETDPDTTYANNLRRYVREARAIGATPILVTSLTRRNFDANGRIKSTLGPYAEAMKRVGKEEGVVVLDLHARSIELCEKLGREKCVELSPRKETGEVDTTHLNAEGSLVFGRLVADMARERAPKLGGLLEADPRPASKPQPDAVVAPDGSGDFKSVQAAIDAAPQNTRPDQTWTILVKPGTYVERIYVQREKRFVRLVGEDAESTVLTYHLNAHLPGEDGKPIGTFRTASVTIDADNFTIENLTLENSAGPVGQALALRVDGDCAIFRNCRFLGWQDTILLNRGRQYFTGCQITGHVDFIFGGATAFFERCHIHCLRNGYITAASTPKQAPYGFVFRDCRITGETPEVKTYLGRPWRDFAAVTFIDTEMSDVVRPEGWNNWGRSEREHTSRYAEYGSTGPGAAPDARVRWARRLSAEEAAAITPQTVLAGADGWNPVGSDYPW